MKPIPFKPGPRPGGYVGPVRVGRRRSRNEDDAVRLRWAMFVLVTCILLAGWLERVPT